MMIVDWEDEDKIKGVIIRVKAFKGGLSNVAGMFARVQSIQEATSRQRATRFKVLFFLTEEAALEGSGVQCEREEDLTLVQLQGHADEDDGDSPSGQGEGEGGGEGGGAKTPLKKAAQVAKRTALRKAMAAVGLTKEDVVTRMKNVGVESVEDFKALEGAGPDHLQEIAESAGLALLEKVALGKYMQVVARVPLQGMRMAADADEDDEDADSDDEDEVPAAPAKAAKAGGEGKVKYPLLMYMLTGVPKGQREAVALDVLEGMCGALGKVVPEREKKNVMASAEAKLKVMGFRMEQLKPEAPGGADEVSALVTELGTGYEMPQAARGARGGAAVGQFATVATGQQEPGMATALGRVVANPDLMEYMQKVMAEGDSAQAVRELSTMGENEAFAALSYKGGELKVPQGVAQTPAVLALVHGLGRLRQMRAEWVGEALREGAHLPAGADALEISWKLVAGKVDEIDLSAVYNLAAGSSMVGSLGNGAKVLRGDSTSDAMLVIMRGLAMLQKGYYVAHPFDGTVVATFTGLQADVVSAVQQGMFVEEAWKKLGDPFFKEVGRKWREVGRLAGTRPVLGVVAEEPRTAHARRTLREHAASCTPAVQVSAADVKKLRTDLEASRASVAELKQKLANKGNGGGGEGNGGKGSGGDTVSMATWKAQNPGRCYFWSVHKTCKFGAQCANSAHPGHPQVPTPTP